MSSFSNHAGVRLLARKEMTWRKRLVLVVLFTTVFIDYGGMRG